MENDLKQQLLNIGFLEEVSLSTCNSLFYDLSRNRMIMITGVGTEKEIGHLCEMSYPDDETYDQMVCFHDYEFDGYITIDRVMLLIYSITNKSLLVK
jgi:hypothetical protein